MGNCLDKLFPSIADLEKRAIKRIPHFASEYLRGGIDFEDGLVRNRGALDRVLLCPTYLSGGNAKTTDTATQLLGQDFNLPFGISPIGLTGLMWPGAVRHLAHAARATNIPMGLSNFATTPMREFREIAQSNGWFQMYPANDPKIRAKMVEDVKRAGFDVLILTVDVPGLTRRRREFKVGLSVPPKLDLRTAISIAAKPRWALTTAFEGIPKFCNLQPYVAKGLSTSAEARAMTDLVVSRTNQEVVKEIRDLWPGKLLIKGILSVEDAEAAKQAGADGIWVSNHGGRQLDAAPSPIDVLPELRRVVGADFPLLSDSGVRTGLDVAKMLALGADFVFLGRAFMYAVCALGANGPAHAIHILKEELGGCMTQIGCHTIANLKMGHHVVRK